MPKILAQPSPIHGQGLFAGQPIAQGDVVIWFTGRRVTTDQMSDRQVKEGHWQGIAPGVAIVRSGPRSLFAYINHAKVPNARVEMKTNPDAENQLGRVMALVPIEEGQEITIDYDLEPMDKRCRKIINEEIKAQATKQISRV